METIDEESFRYALSLSLGNVLGENLLTALLETIWTVSGYDSLAKIYEPSRRHLDHEAIKNIKEAPCPDIPFCRLFKKPQLCRAFLQECLEKGCISCDISDYQNLKAVKLSEKRGSLIGFIRIIYHHLIKNPENAIEGLDFPALRRYLVRGRHVGCRNLESLRTALYRIYYIDVDPSPQENADKSKKA